MGKLLVDVDREALERVRVKLGARSFAEAIRKLIWEADPEWSSSEIASMEAKGPAAPLVINRIMKPDARSVAMRKAADAMPFRPHPKPGKR